MLFTKEILDNAWVYTFTSNNEEIRVVYFDANGNSINNKSIKILMLGKVDYNIPYVFPVFSTNTKENFEENTITDIKDYLLDILADIIENNNADISVNYGSVLDNTQVVYKAILLNNIISQVYTNYNVVKMTSINESYTFVKK